MSNASAEADIAFVRDLVSKACAAGADEAQARVSQNERVEVDFETRQVSMLRTTDDDDTLLTVFKANRKGSAAITGRASEGMPALLPKPLPRQKRRRRTPPIALRWSIPARRAYMGQKPRTANL